MQRFGIRRLGALLSVVLVVGLLAAGYGMVRAQQTDVTVDGPGTPHPGHIHAGSCANLGDVDYALNTATVDNLSTDYESTGDVSFVGSQDAYPVYASVTTLDVSLDEITSSDHAINFHLSADQIDTYIACGDIGGFVRDGVLYVGIAPDPSYTGDVQYAGTAALYDNGDNTTDVVVQFVELPAGTAATGGGTTPSRAATPVSTPIVTNPSTSAAASASESASGSASASETASGSASGSASASETASSSASPIESASASADSSASAEESVAPSVEESVAPSVEASVEPSVEASASA